MAISKERKDELIAQYREWTKKSQALMVAEYTGMTMKDMDALRAKVREVGGEFHIVKNTLGNIALKEAGIPSEGLLSGSTAVCFAFSDAPVVAKAITEFARTTQTFKIKGGFLDKKPMTAEGVKALADMPPLPVMRAQLLGMLSAPASKLVRTLAEPGRSVAAVVKAYADRESAPEAA
ncbi:MAG: 50S ribosomal protein L10 [Anaerolineales bacterium]|nr:50S ribosomal protein L10 [Anaerolineales bacterium]